MQPPDSYVIFPYLRTSKPVWCCGLTLRNSHDLDELLPGNRAHLEKLFPLFFFSDHFRIKQMVYAVLPGSDEETIRMQQARTLTEIQTLLAYIYSSPGGDGRPFFRYEHASCYWVTPGRVWKWSLWEEKHTECLWPEESQPTFNEWDETDGYHIVLNRNIHLSAVSGNRLYPPAPGLWFNHNQDLSSDLERYASRVHNWAMLQLFDENEDHKPTELTRRVFNALEWHNRSTALNVTEDIALLDLAIALECLLNLEPGESVTRRFKETVVVLLGPIPLLDSWLEQFYTARSRIAHDGYSDHLSFYPMDTKALAEQRKGKAKTETETYGLLTGHGRRIFRLCLNAILSGAMLAQNMNLAGAMVPNSERLQRICHILTDQNRTPHDRLIDIRRDVLDLSEFWSSSSTNVDASRLYGTAKALAQLYLQTKPKLPGEVEQTLQAVSDSEQTTDVTGKLKLLEEAAKSIEGWKGDTPFHWQTNGTSLQMQVMREDLFNIVWAFFYYAALPQHRLRGDGI